MKCDGQKRTGTDPEDEEEPELEPELEEEVDLGRSSDVSRRRLVCVRPWTISLISAALSVGGVAASDERNETQRRGEQVPFEEPENHRKLIKF